MRCMNSCIELGGDYSEPLHNIFERHRTWNIQLYDNGNGQIQLRAVRRNPILNLEAQNVNCEIIEKVRLHDEKYVRQKLEIFGRRLSD
jgi:hypothetical protein